MPDDRRAAKTIEKARRRALPAPRPDRVRDISAGDGQPCQGCGETLKPTEECHRAAVGGLIILKFHEECYDAWSTFTR